MGNFTDRFEEGRGPAKDDGAQQAAIALLTKEIRVFDAKSEQFVKRPMRVLLWQDLPELLFHTLTGSEKSIAETYGFGNEKIHKDFAKLRGALVNLALTSRGDRDILSQGESVLDTLITGIREAELEARRTINPERAADQVLFKKSIRDGHAVSELTQNPLLDAEEAIELGKEKARAAGGLTPNEMDHEQAESLFCYNWYRSTRIALEELRDDMHSIRQMLDRDRPDRSSPPSL